MNLKFISLIDSAGRASSLLIQEDYLTVVGGLPHGTDMRPRTSKDAHKLISWLKKNYPKRG